MRCQPYEKSLICQLCGERPRAEVHSPAACDTREPGVSALRASSAPLHINTLIKGEHCLFSSANCVLACQGACVMQPSPLFYRRPSNISPSAETGRPPAASAAEPPSPLPPSPTHARIDKAIKFYNASSKTPCFLISFERETRN